jgi:membrane-bound serine protease (ClpP class)
MLFVIGLVLSLIFLPWPWPLAVAVPLGLIELAEVMLWLRLRNVRSLTGEEGLIGATGRAISDCAPDGQVLVKGQIWKAHCPEGVDAHTDVRVTAVNGLRLIIEPVTRAGAHRLDKPTS